MFYYWDWKKITTNATNTLNRSCVLKESSLPPKYMLTATDAGVVTSAQCTLTWRFMRRLRTHADANSTVLYHGNRSKWGSVWPAGSVACDPDAATILPVKNTHSVSRTQLHKYMSSPCLTPILCFTKEPAIKQQQKKWISKCWFQTQVPDKYSLSQLLQSAGICVICKHHVENSVLISHSAHQMSSFYRLR